MKNNMKRKKKIRIRPVKYFEFGETNKGFCVEIKTFCFWKKIYQSLTLDDCVQYIENLKNVMDIEVIK